MDFNKRYLKLNDQQRLAVDTVEGPVMVIAGPGTGKTELLAMRAANILKQTDTLPSSILCLTFTDSGAMAMRERLVEIIGADAYKVAVHTFHSFGSEIINQYSEFFYDGADYAPADDISSYEIIRSILDELDYSNPLATKNNGEYVHLKALRHTISDLKKSSLASDELLAILDSNDEALDKIEPLLASVFAGGIKKNDTDQKLAKCLPAIKDCIKPLKIPTVPPLAQVIHDELLEAINQASDANSTKPVTTWRNKWMNKNDQNEFVFKTRARQEKLRAASYVYYQYLARMHESRLFDFDDMILKVVHALEVFPELRYNLQERYQYIMVDEFQDTNMAQSRIVHTLATSESAGDMPNVMLVGDDDQAIYSFQGAKVSNIKTFMKTYEKTRRIPLIDNYRSDAKIIEKAEAVSREISTRLVYEYPDVDKNLRPHVTLPDASVRLHEYENIDDERIATVEAIKKEINSGTNPSDIAVLARKHDEITSLLPYFSEANVRVNYERRDNVLELEPVKLLAGLGRVIVAVYESRFDDVNSQLPELLAHPAWGINTKQIWQLSLSAYKSRSTWLEQMEAMPEFTHLHTWLINLASKVPLMPLEQIIDEMIGTEKNQSPESEHDEPFPNEPTANNPSKFKSPIYDYFFSVSAQESNPDLYLAYLEGLRTIRNRLREYRTSETPTLISFLEFIQTHLDLEAGITSIRPPSAGIEGAVNLMTAHKSKGLEFNSVYIIGAVDSSWGERVKVPSKLISYPENLPISETGGTVDERLRLFFVAATRAKQSLRISYSLENDNGKKLMRASFLTGGAWQVEPHHFSHSDLSRIKAAEHRWYEKFTDGLQQPSLVELLSPQLEKYKLSATHLNNFVDITNGGPKTFLLHNLLRFPQAMSPSAAYGSAIHKTLQRAHAHLAATNNRKPIEDILHDFEKNLNEARLSPKDSSNFHQKGSDVLNSFLADKYDSFNPNQKTELNFSMQHSLCKGAHLTGSLDLVDINEDEKTISVTDYKTGKPSLSWKGSADYEKIKLHKYRQQLMFYKLLVERSRDYSGYTVTKTCVQFVEPTNNGDIIRLDLDISSDELSEFEQLICNVWQHITTLNLPDTTQYTGNYKGVLQFEKDVIDGKYL